MTDEKVAAILQVASARGVILDEKKAQLLLTHLEYVIEKNKVINLTRIDGFEDGLVLHIEDSLTLIPLVPSDSKYLCDIGTGAGYPGIPLAVVTGIKSLLIESVKKKATVVNDFVQSNGLDALIEVVPERAEDVSKRRNGHFDVVVARAVTSLPSLVELASPLLSHEGVLLAMKGNPTDEEVKSGLKVAKLVGMEAAGITETSIGNGDFKRTIYKYRKTGTPKVHLPRRTGLAQSKPLF